MLSKFKWSHSLTEPCNRQLKSLMIHPCFQSITVLMGRLELAPTCMNIRDSGLRVSTSGNLGGEDPYSVLEYASQRSWIQFDFNDGKGCLMSYTIVTGAIESGSSHLKQWNIEGSNDLVSSIIRIQLYWIISWRCIISSAHAFPSTSSDTFAWLVQAQTAATITNWCWKESSSLDLCVSVTNFTN